MIGRSLRRALQRYDAALADASPLTRPQLAVLDALGASHKPSLTQGTLIARAGSDRSTLSEMLARMERDGLVIRTAVPGTRGTTKAVSITPVGRATLARARRAEQHASAKVLAAVPAKQRAAFASALEAAGM